MNNKKWWITFVPVRVIRFVPKSIIPCFEIDFVQSLPAVYQNGGHPTTNRVNVRFVLLICIYIVHETSTQAVAKIYIRL